MRSLSTQGVKTLKLIISVTKLIIENRTELFQTLQRKLETNVKRDLENSKDT